MINKEEFNQYSAEFVKWISEYLDSVETFPVRSKLEYGDVRNSIPAQPPEGGDSISTIFEDFKQIILPGITHWQHPNFHAYFPANNSKPSILAEFLTAALGVQGMKWITSPAATELEERMMDWLRQMIGLSDKFKGVIQDTASVSTLCAILSARERATNNEFNSKGSYGQRLRVYCSEEAHSSIEKAVRIAGLGSDNLIKIEVDENFSMKIPMLEEAIKLDIEKGYKPCCIIGALGTTGTCAIDPLSAIGLIAEKYHCWYHIDAAFAGSALVIPEFRESISGLDTADSFVFNPHKWMFTNFDCSAFFVKDHMQLQDTFRIVPPYLQTSSGNDTNDFSNWGIQLGRRFRALKLWFVIRNFGLENIRNKIRQHMKLARYFADWVDNHPKFELLIFDELPVVVFRYIDGESGNDQLNTINSKLLEQLNSSGKLYLSHAVIKGKFVLRFVCAQTNVELKHVKHAIEVITEEISKIKHE